MTVADWLSCASALVAFALLAVVALDRNRTRQRLGNAEGAVTGLGLDLEAMAQRLTELQSYLSRHDSWDVDAAAPAALADPAPADRWTPRVPASRIALGTRSRAGGQGAGTAMLPADPTG